MGRLIDGDELKDVLEYAILANVSTDDANTKEEKLNDWIQSAIDSMPIVEAIPKADYETRLKADLKAILTEIQLKIEENQIIAPQDTFYNKKLDGQFNKGISKASEIIQQKINALKRE